MLKISNKLLYFTIFGILILLLVGWFIYGKISYNKTIADKCSNTNNSSFTVIDCKGILTIESGDSSWSSKYIIRDTKHDYGIAGIYNLKEYKILGNDLYVVNNNENRSESKLPDGSIQYGVRVFIDGDLKWLKYNKLEDIPKYFKINSETGEVKFYKNYDEMSDVEKTVFQNLK